MNPVPSSHALPAPAQLADTLHPLAAGEAMFAGGEVSARALYAGQLAELRARAGLSLLKLAELCRYEQSYLHRLETGARLGSLDVAAALDRFYGTGELLVRLWRLAKREATQLTAADLTTLETAATGIQEYALGAIPELLQTPAYATEQLTAADPRSPDERAARAWRCYDGRPA